MGSFRRELLVLLVGLAFALVHVLVMRALYGPLPEFLPYAMGVVGWVWASNLLERCPGPETNG